MLGLACQYRKDKYKVLNTPLVSWVRRNVPDRRIRDLLFVYYAIEHGNYVIGQWTNKCHTHFVDVLNMGNSLRNFGPAAAQDFKLMFSDPCTGERLEKLARQDYDRRTRSDEDREHEMGDRLRRRLDQGAGKIMVSMHGIG